MFIALGLKLCIIHTTYHSALRLFECIYCHLATHLKLDHIYFLWQGKEPMEGEPSTKIHDDFTDSFKQWVAYGEALCH